MGRRERSRSDPKEVSQELSLDQIVIATHNLHKAGEMETILSAKAGWIDFRSLRDFPGAPEPEETGSTYAANAIIKAESALKHSGLPALADDAGLEIDGLPGELGVTSKRFAGIATSFDEKMEIVLSSLRGKPDEERRARFACFVALARPGCKTKVFSATCEGQIAHVKSGQGGFGYDPIFWLPQLECTMADLTAEQKHEVSHRGRVLRTVAVYLQRVREASDS